MAFSEFSMLMMMTTMTSGGWGMWVWHRDIIHHRFMITMVIFIMDGAIFTKEVITVVIRGWKGNGWLQRKPRLLTETNCMNTDKVSSFSCSDIN